jgi:hypothetical protein
LLSASGKTEKTTDQKDIKAVTATPIVTNSTEWIIKAFPSSRLNIIFDLEMASG